MTRFRIMLPFEYTIFEEDARHVALSCLPPNRCRVMTGMNPYASPPQTHTKNEKTITLQGTDMAPARSPPSGWCASFCEQALVAENTIGKVTIQLNRDPRQTDGRRAREACSVGESARRALRSQQDANGATYKMPVQGMRHELALWPGGELLVEQHPWIARDGYRFTFHTNRRDRSSIVMSS